jgi:hypothetical protein
MYILSELHIYPTQINFNFNYFVFADNKINRNYLPSNVHNFNPNCSVADIKAKCKKKK